MLVSMLSMAAASASTDEAGRPLALPASEPSPEARDAPPAPASPTDPQAPPPDTVTVRDLPRTPSMAVAHRTLLERSLDLRASSQPMDPFWDRPGWTAWPHPWTRPVATMGVFKGSRRLDVPETLTELGDEAGSAELRRRIGHNRMAATILQAVGVAGVGGVVTGLIGRDRSETYGELRRWQGFTAASVGVTVGGFVGSSIPRTRARRLRYDPMSTQDLMALEERIAAHNRALAQELGVEGHSQAAAAPPPL